MLFRSVVLVDCFREQYQRCLNQVAPSDRLIMKDLKKDLTAWMKGKKGFPAYFDSNFVNIIASTPIKAKNSHSKAGEYFRLKISDKMSDFISYCLLHSLKEYVDSDRSTCYHVTQSFNIRRGSPMRFIHRLNGTELDFEPPQNIFEIPTISHVVYQRDIVVLVFFGDVYQVVDMKNIYSRSLSNSTEKANSTKI